MTKKVSEYHDRIGRAVASFRGQEIKQSEILKAYAANFPERADDLQWIFGADHSRNHTNRGPCECSATDRALFERVRHGRYLVL